jgi:hypothetical protein
MRFIRQGSAEDSQAAILSALFHKAAEKSAESEKKAALGHSAA